MGYKRSKGVKVRFFWPPRPLPLAFFCIDFAVPTPAAVLGDMSGGAGSRNIFGSFNGSL